MGEVRPDQLSPPIFVLTDLSPGSAIMKLMSSGDAETGVSEMWSLILFQVVPFLICEKTQLELPTVLSPTLFSKLVYTCLTVAQNDLFAQGRSAKWLAL